MKPINLSINAPTFHSARLSECVQRYYPAFAETRDVDLTGGAVDIHENSDCLHMHFFLREPKCGDTPLQAVMDACPASLFGRKNYQSNLLREVSDYVRRNMLSTFPQYTAPSRSPTYTGYDQSTRAFEVSTDALDRAFLTLTAFHARVGFWRNRRATDNSAPMLALSPIYRLEPSDWKLSAMQVYEDDWFLSGAEHVHHVALWNYPDLSCNRPLSYLTDVTAFGPHRGHAMPPHVVIHRAADDTKGKWTMELMLAFRDACRGDDPVLVELAKGASPQSLFRRLPGIMVQIAVQARAVEAEQCPSFEDRTALHIRDMLSKRWYAALPILREDGLLSEWAPSDRDTISHTAAAWFERLIDCVRDKVGLTRTMKEFAKIDIFDPESVRAFYAQFHHPGNRANFESEFCVGDLKWDPFPDPRDYRSPDDYALAGFFDPTERRLSSR